MIIDLKRAVWLGALILGVFGEAPWPVIPANAQDTARKITKQVQPTYPSIARTSHLHGAVKISAVVAADGTVKSVKTVGGNAVLAKAAEEAVKQWKFEALPQQSVELVTLRFVVPQ
jgi:TonB family protein